MRTAASRTLCLWGCRREGCGGACVPPPTPPDRQLGRDALDILAEQSAEHARALIEGLGTPVIVAARHVARRLGLDPRDVLGQLAWVRVSPSWRTGSRLRPTRRPSRALDIDSQPPEPGKQEHAA